jgi:hypothetical protein
VRAPFPSERERPRRDAPTISSTMSFKSKLITMAIAMSFVFATVQVYIGVSFAQPGPVASVESLAMAPQQTMGILATQGNKEITVNGTNLISGGTIVSGASIETPAGVGATVSLASRASLEIDPNAKLTLEFDQSGVKVMLTQGCVNLRTKKGTTGEIITPKSSAGKTDPAQDGKLETCPGRDAAPILAADGGAGGLFALGAAAAVAIIGEGVTTVAVPVAPRGILY